MDGKEKKMEDDFKNLIQNFWYILQTRDCSFLPDEFEKWQQYAKNLAKEYDVH